MEDLKLLELSISNHPKFDNITRKAEVVAQQFDKQRKAITLTLLISHYIDETAFSEYNRTVKLTLDNKVQFPTGNKVTVSTPVLNDDGTPKLDSNNVAIVTTEEVDETIGDLTYFVTKVNDGASMTALMQAGIAHSDSINTINSKCNYKD